MIESRCGILCSECSFKESNKCAGCIYINKPFWGDVCPIKQCCEGKNYTNCGQCTKFSCDLLNSFAYDKSQGDDGKRIIQCQKWCKGENNGNNS